jgi:hypothetical protein
MPQTASRVLSGMARPLMTGPYGLGGRLTPPLLHPSGSVSDPVFVDAGFGGGFEFGLVVVGVDAGLPGGVVEDAVVVSAQQDQVVEFGVAAVGPVSDVVGA